MAMRLNQKIIEFFKKSGLKNFHQVNREPHLLYPPTEGMTHLYDLYENYLPETKTEWPQRISYGEIQGSPNTKKALQWYKDQVSREQYINSEYFAKVFKRIPGKQTLHEDWHNHDNNSHTKYIYLISSTDTTPVLNLPMLELPGVPSPYINKSLYLPIINKLIKKGIIRHSDIIKPKTFQFLRIHKTTAHMSEFISKDEDVSQEPYRWFMFIKY